MFKTIFQHLINIIRVNKLLKLVSIAIAFLLWLVVVNVSNPEITESVTTEIEITNGQDLMNKGKSFSLDSRTVHISYRVRTNYRSLIHPSSFDAYVDMRDYSITGAVPVYVETDPSISNYISGLTQNPMVIHVTTEDMQEKSFDVTARVNGSPADGFVAGEIQIEPATISLYGPESEIGKVSRVGISLDISGAAETQQGTGKIQYFDANDNVIPLSSNVTLSGDVNYTVPIYKTKSLSVNIPTTGQPARGYTLTGVESEPRFIQVYGEDAVLDRYNTVYLPEGLLDISGVSSNVAISVAMQNYLPEGLYMVQQTDVSIVARIARQTDVIPGAAGLPAPTIQSPPANTQPTAESIPETTAAETTAEETSEQPEETTAEETQEAAAETHHTEPESLPEETTHGENEEVISHSEPSEYVSVGSPNSQNPGPGADMPEGPGGEIISPEPGQESMEPAGGEDHVVSPAE